MSAPMLAIGDGALVFGSQYEPGGSFEKTEEQRCWVHKIANVPDKLPKRLQSDVKCLLHDMMKTARRRRPEVHIKF